MARKKLVAAEALDLIPDTTAGPRRRDVEKAIGAVIRRHRRRRDLTIHELAQSAGLSQGMLSKIENGQTSPSLSTLASLSDALGVPLASFFSPLDESRDVAYVPRGHGVEIDRRGTRKGHIYSLLGHAVRSTVGVEPYLITLTKESEAFAEFRHEGVEFIYMLEGEVVYRHGDQDFHLRPGDSLFFDAIAAHGPSELVVLPARYLSVISYSRDIGD